MKFLVISSLPLRRERGFSYLPCVIRSGGRGCLSSHYEMFLKLIDTRLMSLKVYRIAS